MDLKASLRVLYTINSNPQYILAKSSAPVPAVACNEATHARASLKACLAAVCDSSPELLQDPARDFSLYVLDPLEAQPMPSGLAHSNSPRGVAVALGLMSWALESIDSTNVLVTGTIIPSPSPALEVVFALRETKRMPKPVTHAYPSFDPVPAPGPSQPYHHHHPYPSQAQAAGMGWSSTPYMQQPPQQERQTLTRSADFPELYIGPPRRARGRPEGSTSSKSKTNSKNIASSQPGAGSSKAVNTEPESKQEAGRKSKRKNKQRSSKATPSCPPFICAPLTRNAVTGGSDGGAYRPISHQQSPPSSTSFYPQAQPYLHPSHNPLLGLLSAIPATSGNTIPEYQTALLSALQGLLATNPHLLQLAASNAGLSAGGTEPDVEMKPIHREAEDEHDDQDSDIIVLDSSSVDTTAFRRSKQLGEKDNTSPPISSQDPAMPNSQGTDSSVLPASISSSGEVNTPASSQTSTPSAEPQSTMSPEARTPTSKQSSLGQTEGGRGTSPHILAMPATPTPCRTRKRKLDEYARDQASPSVPMSPPSPAPRATRPTSGSGRALTERQRIDPSLTSNPISSSLALARLPSMLGSMRALANLDSCLPTDSSGSTTRRRLTSLTTEGMENRTTTLDSSSLKMVHPDTTSQGHTPDGTSLKRRRTLNEVMAEHEARQSSKVRKRSSSGRRSEAEVISTLSRAASLQSAKLASTSRHAQSSPPRRLFRSDSTSNLQPLDPILSASACAAPSASTSSAAPSKNPLKNFVVPAWARTSTATLPRLSEEVLARQQAEREAKKAQVSLKRREAAKAKRRRLHDTERPSKESSDEADEVVANGSKQRTMHSSSDAAQSAPSVPLPPPTLPVFASDAVEPIPPSPPQSRRHIALPNAPSTPPRKLDCSGSAPYRTPSKSGSCSLFTPSGQDPGSLFTPSTPSITRAARAAFTPRSPTVLHRSGTKRSPRKGVPETQWTPKRNSNHQTPRSLRTGRNPQFMSGSLAIRTPQTQSGMGTRAFLLPPSPCALRTSHPRLHSKVIGNASPTDSQCGGVVKQESPTAQESGEKDEGCDCGPGDAPFLEDTSVRPERRSHDCPSRDEDEGQGASEPQGINSNCRASWAEEEYASSPLPPSSPLPTSPLSSPVKDRDNDCGGTPTVSSLSVPDSVVLPSVDDSDGLGADTAWLSDNACTPAWLTDSETNAWFTETEAWLTDTEGGPLMTDSDGAWFSDSDAVFGDMSSLPLSCASNWLSDDVDADTDGEVGMMENRDGGLGFDPVAFEQAFVALIERSRQSAGQDERGGHDTTHHTGVVGSDLWTTLQPLLGENAPNGVGPVSGNVGDAVDGEKAAQQLQELLDGLIDT